MRPNFFEVLAEWDAEDGVWVGTCRHVPGGWTIEASTLDELATKFQSAFSELVHCNGLTPPRTGNRFQLITHHAWQEPRFGGPVADD